MTKFGRTESRSLRLTDRPVVFFDLETTSLDKVVARIVEIGAVKILPSGKRQKLELRIRPDIPIPAESTEIHGITDADVYECPLFEAVAEKIHAFFSGCDLAGFNVVRYDIPVLCNCFKRVGLPLSLAGVSVIDTARIFHMREPRDLSAAVAFYTDRFHVGAHSAMKDTEAAIDVLFGQLEMYEDIPTDPAGLYDMIREPGTVDLGGKIGTVDGKYCFTFGKHQGEALVKVPSHYLEWTLANVDFGPDALNIVRDTLAARDAGRVG